MAWEQGVGHNNTRMFLFTDSHVHCWSQRTVTTAVQNGIGSRETKLLGQEKPLINTVFQLLVWV